MNTIPIVFCFDNNLVKPACVCLSSLMMSANEDTFYDIFILHSHKYPLEHNEIDKLLLYYKNCRIQYKTVDGDFENSYEVRGITVSTYYRLLIPELIPEYDKVLYSDVDVIFREDLSKYYNTDLGGYYVAGVNSLSHFEDATDSYYRNSIGINPESVIYAGNLIMNLKLMREDNVVDSFKTHIDKKYRFQDLDILNIVCKGKIKYLSPSYCLTTYISEYNVYRRDELLKVWGVGDIEDALRNGIVHFNGKKPWNDVCINFDIWWEYYRRCPFFDEKLYYDFFYRKLDEYDRLPLLKRIKILVRYFVFGRKKD